MCCKINIQDQGNSRIGDLGIISKHRQYTISPKQGFYFNFSETVFFCMILDAYFLSTMKGICKCL